MKKSILMILEFSLIVLSVSLIGCAKEMTSKQFEPIRETQIIQLTDEQAAEASASCQYLGDHSASMTGFTVSHDDKLVSSKFDKIVTELGGNRYYITDSKWISDQLGGTNYYVLFDVYQCVDAAP